MEAQHLTTATHPCSQTPIPGTLFSRNTHTLSILANHLVGIVYSVCTTCSNHLYPHCLHTFFLNYYKQIKINGEYCIAGKFGEH